MRTILRRVNIIKPTILRHAEDGLKAEKVIYKDGANHYYFYHHHHRGGFFKKFFVFGVVAWAGYHAIHHFRHHDDYYYYSRNYGFGSANCQGGHSDFGSFGDCFRGKMKVKQELMKDVAIKGVNSKEGAMLHYMHAVSLMNFNPKGAQFHLDKALEIGKQLGDESSYFVKTVEDTLEILNKSQQAQLNKQNKSSQDSFEGSAEIIKSVHGKNSKEVGQFYYSVGKTYIKTQDYKRAAASLGEAHRSFVQNEGDESQNAILAGKDLAGALKQLGENEKAKKLLEETFQRSIRVFGETHPETIKIYSELQNV